MQPKRFKRVIEDFECERCGAEVHGTGYTDHCPRCLASKHVDVNPGDRESTCSGLMDPIGAEYKGGEFTIEYRCERCGARKRFRASLEDNKDVLVDLSQA